jgi:SP family sugar:H+ symporter-like MFS transporter
VRKDDIHAAANALSRLRRVPPDDPGLIEELVEIKASHDYELSFGSYSIWDCFRSDKARPHQLKRLLTAVVLQAIQQCSGINFIFYYGVNFFTRTGVSNSYLISFVTYAVNVLATVPGLFLVEIIGRRKILMIGGSIMGLANLLIGIVGVTADSMVANKVMIAFVCLFIASFAATWGPVVWVVTGEIFSLGVRGKAVAISAATNWLVNFVFAYITPYLVDTGTHTAALGTNIFFMWGGFNLIGVVFVYFMVYETKGLSLEQIDELYRSCPGAIGSSAFEVKLNFNQDETELGDLNLGQSKRDEGSTLPSTGISHSSSQPVAGLEKSEVTTDTLAQPMINYNTSTFNPGYTVDLGYGLGVTNQNRGPPSLNTMSSDEESIPEREPVVFDSLSGYVSSLSSQNGTYGGPLTTESTSTGVSSALSASQAQKQQALNSQTSTSQNINNDYNDSSSSAESSLFDE